MFITAILICLNLIAVGFIIHTIRSGDKYLFTNNIEVNELPKAVFALIEANVGASFKISLKAAYFELRIIKNNKGNIWWLDLIIYEEDFNKFREKIKNEGIISNDEEYKIVNPRATVKKGKICLGYDPGIIIQLLEKLLLRVFGLGPTDKIFISFKNSYTLKGFDDF